MLTETLDLHSLSLTFGEGLSLELEVPSRDLELGGQEYAASARSLPARLDVSRTSAGYALRLRFTMELSGPCVRCLEPALARVEVDAREVDQPADSSGKHRPEPDEEEQDAELESPYVEHGVLDLVAWTRDALALALPAQILCRPDCAGLCPECGESLNDAAPGEHDHGGSVDPRWAKLREL